MRIAYLVASSDVAGGQRVIFQQAEALADLGCEITLVCPEPEPAWFPIQKAQWETTPFDKSKALADADIRVATFWTTVLPAVRDFGGPVFHLCQGYEADFSFNAPNRGEIELAYGKIAHKLAVSPHLSRRLRAAGYTPVTYVGQTFNRLEFPPEKRRRFDQTLPTILLVGIFEADVKGIREALEALAEVRRSGTAFSLRRVSTWPLSMEEKSIFMPDEYHFRLTPPEMGEVYRSSDLLIGPSHPEEGFGLPVLEALSSGLPALLSDTPGHRHIAREAAEYFPCADTAALGLGVSKLMADPTRRAELSAMGPEEAARFRTEDVADRLLAEFIKALGNHH
jgi:glycosyltransferase involved in cell wall biosynthesis